MSRKKAKLDTVDGETSGDASGGGAALERLSALPDELLHKVMSFVRAWEVAHTCVLSRRWRHLWASAPCVDLRVCCKARHRRLPRQLAKFAYRFLLEREVSAPVDTLRLLSSPPSPCNDERLLFSPPRYDDDGEDYCSTDVEMWIRAAINRRARVIQLSHHPRDESFSYRESVPVISCHLKQLKLSSRCPSLEVLELRECYLDGPQISSASLMSLIMVECRIVADLSVIAPNLVSLCCVTPYHRAPSFENLGSLAAGTIMLDDSFLRSDFAYNYKDIDEDAFECSSDSASDSYDDGCGSDADSDVSTCEYSELANDYEDKQRCDYGEGHNDSKHANYHGYGNNHRFYGVKVLGGQNVLRSLSNATSLELIDDAGEVILNRELETCPVFSNLKALSLGEWCMAADLDPLVSFLQHAPNLERLFLELMDHDKKMAMEDNITREGRSFACTYLTMVKIECPKDDERVHVLAQLFMANGIPIEKIYVRQTCRTCLPTKPW